ncbi:MAG: hypothetical protein IH845_04440 [Nanoarchaeota archaeon]|nr:hypothetical protein [Nanoarchaeota archaeon]
MASEDLYLSLNRDVYKSNKSNLLNSQVDLLKILKNTYNLKVLRRRKRDLKLKLASLISGTIISIENLQNEIPHPRISDSLNRKEPKIEELETKNKIKKPKKETEYLDDELLKIQEKLRELNS